MSAEVEVDASLQLRGPLAESLIRHAVRLKQEPAELLADIIETVLGDDLVEAVIDR